jgi:hypothetical protein
VSRRTNMLLILALAVGVAYGRFAIPFFLPLVSDHTEALVEEQDAQALSEVDDIRLRIPSLKPGMCSGEVDKLLDLANKHSFLSGCLESDNTMWMSECYPIGQRHALHLKYVSSRVVSAELRDGEQVVARVPAAK